MKNSSANKLLYLVIFLLINIVGISQSDYHSSGVIYKDSYVTVELQYKMNDPCVSGGAGKNSRYRLVITGTANGNNKYLNWRMDYYNCDQSITSQTCNFNIGTFLNEGPVENIDWKFDGYKIEVPYYEVSVTSSPEKRASYIKALPKSAPPKSISGNVNLQYGDQTTLSVKGGVLGIKAQWKWYSDLCGNNLLGTGDSINLYPTSDFECFVRAESPTDTTNCASIKVKVNLRSIPPDHIEGKNVVCTGVKDIPLSVAGGKLGKGAEWIWYQDTLFKKPIGKGKSILVSPEIETIYYVRAESNIDTTEYKTLKVTIVDEKLEDPEKIIGSSFVCKGETLQLKVSGGHLSSTAAWYWYKNDIQIKNIIGKGSSINVAPDVDATYYLRGEEFVQ